MRLIIFGATGKIGRQLMAQALTDGHKVTAFARTPATLDLTHENLRVIKGDVLDPPSISRAFKQPEDGDFAPYDAVLCALGMPLLNKDRLRSAGTRNIVHAMEEAGIQRLICLSSLGAGDSRAGLPAHYRYLLAPILMRRLLVDHNLQESHIVNSALDWTIVRPGNFTDGDRTGSYRHGFASSKNPVQRKISQADVADFMLSNLSQKTYLHQAPSLSY